MRQNILVVDDDQNVLDALRRSLRDQSDRWAMTFVGQPEAAWEKLLNTAYDAVVTDFKMPGLSGLDLLERIRQTDKTKDLPVVMFTGVEEQGLKQRVLEAGGADLLQKPLEVGQLVARLQNILQAKAHQDELIARNELLAEKIRQQNIDLAQSRMSIICRLGMAAEFRDEDTGNHVIRVGCYSRAVAGALGMPRSFVEMLLLAAPLHDIGKIGIPDSVLLKPGPLDDNEWAVMQRHCEIGERILREQSKAIIPLFDWYALEPRSMQDAWENRDPVLDMAATVALTHHEKWDGSGYPNKLAGEAIPLESRIVAIADVFDALTSNRPYRPARPEEESLTIIEATVGSHFDPRIYNAFLRSLPEIRAIRKRFQDDVVVFPEAEGVPA